MAGIQGFRERHPARDVWRAWTPEVAARLAGRLPTEQVELLSVDGFASYDDQLLWAVDPDDLGDVVRLWLPVTPMAVPLFRTAFGDLFLWDGTAVWYADVHLATVGQVALLTRFLYDDVLINDRFRRRVLRPALLKRARKAVGRIGHDEMYQWSPALGVGGAVETSAIVKGSLREGLVMLAQLGPITRS